MLDAETVQEIRRLLAEGKLSQRQIARVMGVNRGTVLAIARGRRPDYEASRQQRKAELLQPDDSPQRCPQCGGLVVMPCRRCRLEKLIREGRLARPIQRAEEDLELELAGAHRERYQRLHARRLAGEMREELL